MKLMTQCLVGRLTKAEVCLRGGVRNVTRAAKIVIPPSRKRN